MAVVRFAGGPLDGTVRVVPERVPSPWIDVLERTPQGIETVHYVREVSVHLEWVYRRSSSLTERPRRGRDRR